MLLKKTQLLNLDSNDNLAYFDPKFGTEVHCGNGFIHSEIIIWSIEKIDCSEHPSSQNFCKQFDKTSNKTVNKNAISRIDSQFQQ